MLLSTHYRTQLNFTFEGMQAAVASLERIDDFIHRLSLVEKKEDVGKVSFLVEESENKFKTAIGEDLNIALALGALFDLIRSVNVLIDKNEVSLQEVDQILNFFNRIDEVLGTIFFESQEEEIPVELLGILHRREEARSKKDWKLADECRDLILQRGYFIEDNVKGARLKKK